MSRKVILVSRCAWTLYNFRLGLMKTLVNRGYTVLGGGAGGDSFEPKVEALEVPFHRLPVSFKPINPFADLHLIWTLYRWYRRERPDVVHHFTIRPVIYGSLAARLAGVPRIVNTVTGLGYVFIEKKSTLLRWIVQWLYRRSLAMAHYTFFLNKEDRQLFLDRRLIHYNKAGLLPGEGVDIEHFATPVGFSQQDADNALIFIMTARLLRDKGVYEFVEAARLVKARYPDSKFHLLGNRDERNPTVVPQEDLDRWQSEGIIEWLGETSDVRKFIALAHVVVLPSYYREGVPRSLLEAAAMAKPVITTDAVGCREAVDHEKTGLLVPVKDAKALAQAMTRMIENPEMRERMGKAGRKKVEQEFDERIVIEKIIKVYNT